MWKRCLCSQVSSCGCWPWVSVLAATPLASQSSNMWLTCMEMRWDNTHTHSYTHTGQDSSQLTGSRNKRRLKRSTKAIQSQTHSIQTDCVCVCVVICIILSSNRHNAESILKQLTLHYQTNLWFSEFNRHNSISNQQEGHSERKDFYRKQVKRSFMAHNCRRREK